jgi:hypothetical protein
MKIRVMIAPIVVVWALAGCKPPEHNYPIPLAEAMERLDKADVIGFRNARQCGLLINFRHFWENNSITWDVRSNGREVLGFTVVLTPTSRGTRTDIVVPTGENGGELYDGKQHYSHPAVMQPLRPAVQELIDSAMEKRSFDWRRLPDPINIGPSRQNCSIGQQSLARGGPIRFSDPEGITHQDSVRFKLNR